MVSAISTDAARNPPQEDHNQATSFPPRGLCLREALTLLYHHKSATVHELRTFKAPMLLDGELQRLYVWAFGFPENWLDSWSVPDWWVHTPLPAMTRLYQEAVEALRKARGDDEAKRAFRTFMELAGSGPNLIISDSTGILSKDACASPDQVALATAINSYVIQYGSNVPGSFLNVHHVNSKLLIIQQDGTASAPRFQSERGGASEQRGSMEDGGGGGPRRAGDGGGSGPQALAAKLQEPRRLAMEAAGNILAGAIHHLSHTLWIIFSEEMRNGDSRSQPLTSEAADAADDAGLTLEDINFLEGDTRYGKFRRNQGRADQNFEKRNASTEQVKTREELEALGIHFFEDMPDANRVGKDRHGKEVKVFGDDDEHRVFFVNGKNLILKARTTILRARPIFSETFKIAKAEIMRDPKYPQPTGDAVNVWDARTTQFFARLFLQHAVSGKSTAIFETIVTDLDASKGKGRPASVETGAGNRTECKCDKWDQCLEDFKAEHSADADLCLRVELGYLLARVLVFGRSCTMLCFKLSETLFAQEMDNNLDEAGKGFNPEPEFEVGRSGQPVTPNLKHASAIFSRTSKNAIEPLTKSSRTRPRVPRLTPLVRLCFTLV